MSRTTLAAPPPVQAPSVAPAAFSRHELVASLLDGTCRLADVPRLAVLLGTPAHASYAVVAVAGPDPAARLGIRAGLAPSGTHWHTRPEVDHAIVHLRSDHRIAPHGPLPAGVRAGVGLEVESLAAVDEARRLADLALSLVPRSGGFVRLDEQLATAIVRRSTDLAQALAGRVLGPVLAEPPAERDVLLRTLAAWFDADGCTVDAAAALGCHRNTVTNRLRRVARLTGRSTDRPRDVVDLALALQHAAPGPEC